jgi:hypothetical protein
MLWAPVALIFAALSAAAETIPIVADPQAAVAERTAAQELSERLERLYPRDRFPVADAPPAEGPAILLGSSYAAKYKLTVAGSFAVTTDGRFGVVAGADPPGTLYGVYALLERLGWGFYLSYEAAPPPRREAFSFAGWELASAPLVRDRVVFNWHNFLSSATTWDDDDWAVWIRGAARLRYNTVMVHAYGNNPMFSFLYNGEAKPAGYLATTEKGRDWGTEHVNDVRRMVGGGIFSGPVFGSIAALVPEKERAAAAQGMLGRAFTLARTYGLHVTFAVDVDTESANPQNIVRTLPEAARFTSGNFQLANPDTAAGYAYWKAQVQQLLDTYPQVDRLVVWFRHDRTPWRNLKPEEFPAAWKRDYAKALAGHPALRGDKNAPTMFAIARIVAAYARALHDLKRGDVELGAGTWFSAHLPAADLFFPLGVKLYWLDASTVFDRLETQAALRAISRERPMLPIVWAHHDDRTYIGSPYTPFRNFAGLLDGTGTGFGVIHWTTRPLDLYFKSLAEQVWTGTRNRPLAETAREMASRSFGPSAAELGGEYLAQWVTEGRRFGRETTDRFIDVPLTDAAEVIARSRARLALLARIDETALPAAGRERLHYYRGYEEFVAGFFHDHAAFERAQALYQGGDVAAARTAIAESDPRRSIERYVAAASHGGITRGERALVVSLNLRWLPYILSLRQALGMEPARYRFAPTQHEPLAQGAGNNSFWLDEQRALWKTLGEKETGAPATAAGIRVDKPLPLKLAAIMGDRLAPGRYRVAIAYGPASRPPEERTLDVTSGSIELTIPAPAVLTAITIYPQGTK